VNPPAAEGLSGAEAAARLRRDGFNELPSPERRGFLRIVREVLSEPMFGLLLAAGAIYLVLGDLGEAVVLFVFANLSVLIAVAQETRSERVLDALREMTSPMALVVRDGEQRRIPARELVRGDLLLLAEGDRIPADAILREGAGTEVDESLLTGESMAVSKRPAGEPDLAASVPAPGGDDLPWLYAGTLLVRGSGRAEVTATGSASEMGKIGRSLGSIEAEPPRLQAQTRRLVRIFGVAGASVSVLVFVLYATLRGSFTDALLAGIAVGMTLLPEEFPLILTVFMVMGAWRISRSRVLTRRSAAIESLGAATILCTDKTGTLTHNRMSVVTLSGGTPGTEPSSEWTSKASFREMPAGALPVMRTALLASARDALDPMDRACHALAEAADENTRAWLDAHPPLRVFALSPELPAMTVVYRGDDAASLLVATKGAPEAVAKLCGFGAQEHAALAEAVDRMAAGGVRVLAVGEATVTGQTLPSSPSDVRFRFVGLAGFADPLRDGVPEAVTACRQAGVRVVMITGDYPATARAIAREAGIDAAVVLSGNELEALDDEALTRRVRECSVFARILPLHKLRIVQALKAAGEIVAMTGDGVNDAPSLRAAHIGIAMGVRGTDVAREASSIVLLDDDFASIPQTLRLGRRIFDNLRKAMGYVLALHVPIAGLAVLPLFLGMPLILTPTMIAFLEMIIDPVCSVVFEAETEERDVMHRPPRDPASPILPRRLLAWCAFQGVTALLSVSAVFLWALSDGIPESEVRSVVFASLVTTNVALIFVNRSFGGSAVEVVGRPNRVLWWVLATVALLVFVVIGWSPARELFRFGPMHLQHVGACLLVGAVLFAVLQAAKRLPGLRLAS
jgi:Ca2+-transporting ATPase